MTTINLVHSEESELKYNIITFPDGEPHIKLEEPNRKEIYIVKCRVCNPTDLFILAQVADILDRCGVKYTIEIYYLMSMRMDRVISFNEAFSLQLVCGIINSFVECGGVYVLEPHSSRTLKELDLSAKLPNIPLTTIVESNYDQHITVLPDHGAYCRYMDGTFLDEGYIICKKVRDTETGNLLSFEIEEDMSEGDSPMLVVDDLCDGGGTFAGISKLLREKYPNRKLSIFVTHMVNPKGIRTLSENYDEVTFTNSYKDWDKEALPKNVKVIKVI